MEFGHNDMHYVLMATQSGLSFYLKSNLFLQHQQGRPFYFTFFISNEVKLHPTDSARVEDFLNKHVGTLVTPPASPERLAELGPFEDHVFTVSRMMKCLFILVFLSGRIMSDNELEASEFSLHGFSIIISFCI